MDIQEFFRQLSIAELSNSPVGNRGDGTIRDSDQPAVLLYLNDALREMHMKFSIKEKAFFLQPIEGKDRYKIHSDYAVSSVGITDGPHYIIDTVDEPYQNDLLQFLDAVDSEGNVYAFNKGTDRWSLHTPEWDVLQLPYAKETSQLAIEYKVRPVELILDDLDAEIDLPRLLFPALRSFVAARIFNAIGSQEAMMTAQKHEMLYASQLASIDGSNALMQNRNNVAHRFNRNGWV